MSQSFQQTDPILLWPNGAPGALGDKEEDRPVLKPFIRAHGDPVAAVIVCPGGGYSHRARHEAEPVAQWLNSLGLASFVLEYRVAPYKHPQPLNDAQRAIRIVRSRAHEWSIDPKRIGILGFSAGGHLACCAATMFEAGKPDATDSIERESSRPDLLIACYPVVTMGLFTHQGSRKALLGDNPDQKVVTDMSAETRVTPQTPPAFLWTTANDQAVPVQNTMFFADALAMNRVPFELHVFPNGKHGLGLAPQNPDVHKWLDLCADFLENQKFIPDRSK
jgi:acetyl esterase/lipase